MPEERPRYPADPPSTGASRGRAHPHCLPGLLSDGDVEASAADACSRPDATGSSGKAGRHSNARRIFSDHRWPSPGHAALHRTRSRAGDSASSPEPRIATATTSAHHHFRFIRSISATQNVVQTFETPLLKTKGGHASNLPNCEGSVRTEGAIVSSISPYSDGAPVVAVWKKWFSPAIFTTS